MSAAADAPPPPSARFGADADEPPFPADAVEVGRVLGAYGIKGWIRVQAFSGDPKALFSSKRWFLQPALPRPGAVPAPAAVAATPPQQPLPRLLRITQSRQQGDDVVAGAQEVPDRNAAEALKGARVFVARSSFPTAAEGEYYWVDLMGLAVFNREGQALGVVTDLLDTGAHSVLKLRGPACGADGQPDTAAPEVERLIPFVAAYVDQVDLPGRRITVDWGLDYSSTGALAVALHVDVLTLFPELFEAPLRVGITRRAFEPGGALQVRLWPLRDFAEDAYRRVDDRPYGGGPGMVMLAEPLERALAAVRARAEAEGLPPRPLIHFSPTGAPITQRVVEQLAAGPGAVLLCGRYEGIDQRVLDRHVTQELSLGDFVLSGGELPALALLDAVARLQPGVLTAQSHQQDSFGADGLLDCPHYSRPEQLALGDGATLDVPAVLLSGHHGQIARWRREQSLRLTAQRRPDLIAAARAAGRLDRRDEAFLAALCDPS